jgi:serine/threonine-protein kinase
VQLDDLVARSTRRDPSVRPVDAGAFLAELADLRTDLGIAPVPVPTGRSTAGPGTLRPTNRPHATVRPRHPSDPLDPGTEVLGGRPGRGTSMLPGMGAGPTAGVGGRRPPVRTGPGVPEHVRRRRMRLAVAIVLLLAVTIGAVAWWLGSGRWTTVPALAGKPEDTAIGLLQEAGLDPACCVREFSETVPSGVVISATPATGDAVRGTDVRLTVSKGPERFVVPAALKGQPQDAVLTALKDLPVAPKVAQQYDDTVAPGTVLDFVPPAGTPLKRGDAVTVVVSKGHRPVQVPDVVGLSPEAATKNLQQLGFTVQRGPDGRSPAVAPGQVMTVLPDPKGGAVAYGSTVTITVSAGVPQVTVPDVRGQKVSDAQAALQQLGLKVSVQTFITGNRVVQQSVSGGTVVDQGTTVTLLASF